MNIYQTHEFESTFIEIVNSKKSNMILHVVYRHPGFNDKYVNELLDKASKESKTFFIRVL